MLKRNLLVVLISCLFFNSTFSQQNVNEKNALPATFLKPYGRFEFDKDGNLELISSAVHFGFSFTGKECVLYAFMNDANNHGYLQYELDGVYQKRIKVNGGSVQPVTVTADTNGEHTIEIYKCTEATTGSIFIQKITGKNIHAI